MRVGRPFSRSPFHGARVCSRGAFVAILAAALVSLCGCAGAAVTASQATVTHVALHLDAGSYSLSASTTTIRGTASRGARVTVNGHRAANRAGHWSKTLHLHLGGNRVKVTATLAGHTESRKTITVTRQKTAAEVEAEAKEHEGSSQPAPAPASTPPAEETCTNGTYVNSAGNTVCRPENSPTVPAGATAECADGTYSFSQSRSGTCSHHGGVARWLE